jgi:hypothetical protein
MSSSKETGCTFTFDAGKHTLLQAIGNEVMVRTRTGLNACRISDAVFSKLVGGTSGATCGGYQLRVHQTGRIKSYEASDSAIWPATLTIGSGRAAQTLRGNAATAC